MLKKDPLYKLISKKAAVGLLCNQSAWSDRNGQYTFRELAARKVLKKVFIPEHGLFGELQDQVKLDDTSVYGQLAPGVEWISVYSAAAPGLTATDAQLRNIDTLVIDIQDSGSRYFTFTSSIYLLLKRITELDLDITVIVNDKPNPAGRQVEGTRIRSNFASFIGLEGLPHRHGLTIGEMCRYFRHRLAGNWELIVVPVRLKHYRFIAPSPNIPDTATCMLYSGQCLWEGTLASEGRGTTQPFRIAGAPYMNWVFTDDWNERRHPAHHRNCVIRPLSFIPVFHKYSGVTCHGFELYPDHEKGYHSLAHSLQLIRYCRERSPELGWRPGTYEAFNDKTAIELLAGDQLILDHLNGLNEWKELRQWFAEEEHSWIETASPFLIYKPSLSQLKIK